MSLEVALFGFSGVNPKDKHSDNGPRTVVVRLVLCYKCENRLFVVSAQERRLVLPEETPVASFIDKAL